VIKLLVSLNPLRNSMGCHPLGGCGTVIVVAAAASAAGGEGNMALVLELLFQPLLLVECLSSDAFGGFRAFSR